MESPEEIKQRATKAYQKRDFVGAIALYSEAQQLDEKNEVYPSNKAACFYEMGAYTTAISQCDQALELVSKKEGNGDKKEEFEAKVLVRKAKALVHGGGKFSVAISCLERAREICPKYFNSNASFSSLLKYCQNTSEEGLLEDTLDEVLEDFLDEPPQQNEDKLSVHVEDFPIHRADGYEPLGTEYFPVGHDDAQSYLGALVDLAEGAKDVSPFSPFSGENLLPPPKEERFLVTCASSREFVKNIPPLPEEQQKILNDLTNAEKNAKMDDFGQTILRLEESSAKMIEFRKTDPLSRYRPEQFRLRTNCPTVSTFGHLRVHLHEQSNDDLSKLSFLAGGIGDGRHLLGTFIDVIGQVTDLQRAGKHEEVQRLKQNIKMKVIASDISPDTHARNIFVWLLIEKIGRYFEGKDEGEVDESFLDFGESFMERLRKEKAEKAAKEEMEVEEKGGEEAKEGEKGKEEEEGKEVQKGPNEEDWWKDLTEGQGELAALNCILYYVMSCAFMPRPLYYLFHRIVKVLIKEAENALKNEEVRGKEEKTERKDISVGGWLEGFSIFEEEGEEGEGEGKRKRKREEMEVDNEEEKYSPSSFLPSLPCDWLVIEGKEALEACLRVWKSWLGDKDGLIDSMSRAYRPVKVTEDLYSGSGIFGSGGLGMSEKMDVVKEEQSKMLEGMIASFGEDQIDQMLKSSGLYESSDSIQVKRKKVLEIMKEVALGPGGGFDSFHPAMNALGVSLKETNLPPVPLEYAALVSSGLMWRMSGLKKGDVDVEDMNQKYTKEQKGGGKNEREWRRPFFAFPGVGKKLEKDIHKDEINVSPNWLLRQKKLVLSPSNLVITSLMRYTLNPTAFPDQIFDHMAMGEAVSCYNLQELLSHLFSSNLIFDPKIPNINSTANAYRFFGAFIRTAAIGLHWLGRRGEGKEEESQIKICVSLEDVHRRMLAPLLNRKNEGKQQEAKFNRIFLSNIPDYTSVLGTFLDVKGVLGGNDSCLVFNNMYNPPLWKNLDQFLHTSLFLTTKQLPNFLKMKQAGGSLHKEMVFSLSSSPPSSSLALSVPPQNLPFSRVEFETWLVTVLFSLGLPTIRQLGLFYEHRAPTMQRWFLLILHLIENDIVPRHWVSEVLESILTNSVKTKARVPHSSPCETPFSAQLAKNTKASIDFSPLLIELRTLASFYLPLLGSSSANGDSGSFFALPHTLPLSLPPREKVRKYWHKNMGFGAPIGQALACVGFLVFDEAWAKYSMAKSTVSRGIRSFGKAVHEYFNTPKAKKQGQLYLFSCVEYHNLGTGKQSGALFLSEEDFNKLVSLKMRVLAIRTETYELLSDVTKLDEFKPE